MVQLYLLRYKTRLNCTNNANIKTMVSCIKVALN